MFVVLVQVYDDRMWFIKIMKMSSSNFLYLTYIPHWYAGQHSPVFWINLHPFLTSHVTVDFWTSFPSWKQVTEQMYVRKKEMKARKKKRKIFVEKVIATLNYYIECIAMQFDDKISCQLTIWNCIASNWTIEWIHFTNHTSWPNRYCKCVWEENKFWVNRINKWARKKEKER